MGKVQATGPVHQTQVDTLPTADSLAIQEGTDLTIGAVTTPSFLTNIVQSVARSFGVSDLQRKTAHYNGEDMLAYQTMKAAKELGNALEVDLVRSTLVSGASGTVPKMSGIVQAVSKSSNSTVQTSGTTFSASIVNGLLMTNWNNGNGVTASDMFMGSYLRNVVDGFTQKSNTLVQVASTEIENDVDVINTSFGRLNIHVHRYVQSSLATSGTLGADSTGRVLAVRPEYLKIAYLNPIYTIDLAKTGATDKKAYVADLTLSVRNQDPHFSATGYNIG